MRPPSANRYRDRWAGELRSSDVGQTVRVSGWVNRRRDHGGLIFIDLRDRSGIVQLVFGGGRDDIDPDAHALAESLRPEHVLAVQAKVVSREGGQVNANLPTGEIELSVASAERLSEAVTPPFSVDEEGPLDELLRLRNRVVDLRRPQMAANIALRHTITQAMRDYLNAHDFLDVETPMLTRSTPEGARDFLVPARLAPGAFYALPQSPQLFKQLLMVAGFERYYQIARCFRDEDLRADRQPEFTQLDVELSFVEEDDVIELTENLLERVFEAAAFDVPAPPWTRMPYAEAMLRFGSDKPDLRCTIEIADLGDAVAGTEFRVFAGALSAGGVVRGFNAGPREVVRRELDELTEHAKRFGARGLVWAVAGADGSWDRTSAGPLGETERQAVSAALAAAPGDLLLLVADEEETAATVAGELRLEIARRFELFSDRHEPLWVTDFPMFAYDKAADRFDAIHHPFTAPTGDWSDPASMLSRGYDVVLDGTEIGGGSIRIHSAEEQQRVFDALKISPQEAQTRFGFLLDGLRYGAPPHGGIALGLDRIVAIVAGEPSIRDVIAFPKTAGGTDPLTGAPAPVDQPQLQELFLRSTAPPPA